MGSHKNIISLNEIVKTENDYYLIYDYPKSVFITENNQKIVN